MSRLAEAGGFDGDDEAEAEFLEEVRAAYAVVQPDLLAFLAYLDAMPRKRIVASCFVDRETGDTCAIAAFCAFKGMTKRELYKIERDSREQRRMNGGPVDAHDLGVTDGDTDTVWRDGPEDGDGWHGPTQGAGERAGLPEYAAHDLAWRNDMIWDRMPVAETLIPGTKGRLAAGDEHEPANFWTRLVPDENGGFWITRPRIRVAYADMLPEERWLRLRNHVAARVGAPTIALPAEWPTLLHQRAAFALKYPHGEIEVNAP